MVDLFHSNDEIAGLDLHLIRFDVGTLGTNMGLILPMEGMPGLHMGLIHADDAFGQSIHKKKLERVLKASTLRPSSSIDNNQSGIKALSFYGETLFGHLIEYPPSGNTVRNLELGAAASNTEIDLSGLPKGRRTLAEA